MDLKTQAKEALVIIGKGTPESIPTKRLVDLYGVADNTGRWRILETLSKRRDISSDDVLSLARSYTGEIGMIVLGVAIQPVLSRMSFGDLLCWLSKVNPTHEERTPCESFELVKAIRYEIIQTRLPKMSIEEILGISMGEDQKVVQAVMEAYRKLVKDLIAIAEA